MCVIEGNMKILKRLEIAGGEAPESHPQCHRSVQRALRCHIELECERFPKEFSDGGPWPPSAFSHSGWSLRFSAVITCGNKPVFAHLMVRQLFSTIGLPRPMHRSKD